MSRLLWFVMVAGAFGTGLAAGALQDVRALPAIQEVLDREQDLMMRRAAAYGLRLLQMPETIPVLSTLLADKQDDRFVRMSAAYGLAQLGEAQGVTGLMQLFDEAEKDGRGRFLAFRALTSLNDPAALPLMRQLATSDADVSYRVAAMRFLAEHGDQEALPLLQRVLDSPHEQPSGLEAAAQTHASIASGQPPTKAVGATSQGDTGARARGGIADGG